MSYYEALAYSDRVEATRDREMYLRDMKQAEYENKCTENHKYICSEFQELRDSNENLFSAFMWQEMERYVENYTTYPETSLNEVLRNYMEDGNMWEDWEKLNPSYTEEMEAEFDKSLESFKKIFEE